MSEANSGATITEFGINGVKSRCLDDALRFD